VFGFVEKYGRLIFKAVRTKMKGAKKRRRNQGWGLKMGIGRRK